jgi:hypothetical protein
MLSPEPSRREARDEAPLCSLVDLLTPPSLESEVCGLDAFSPSPRLPRLGSLGLILPARFNRANKALRSIFGIFG